jgi:hypothetical protein
MKILLFVTFLVFLGKLSAQEISDSLRLIYLKEVVSYLASDSLEGRSVGSKGEKLAADYIVARLKENKNLKVTRQYFNFKVDTNTYYSQNVIGFINNHSSETVVISAHYDHIGFGGALSKSNGVYAVHNGADDNASGVSLMLDLARFVKISKTKYNYLFVAYSGHELGLYGSRFFSEHISKKYKKIILTINLDMVGRMDNDNKIYYDCTPSLEKEIKIYCEQFSEIKIIKSSSNRINILDSKWFAEKEIPCIMFTTGLHSDYHKTTDDEEYISYSGILKIENLIKIFLIKQIRQFGFIF